MARPLSLKPHPLPAVTDPLYEIIIRGTATDGGAGVTKSENVFVYRQTTLTAPVNKINLAAIFRTTIIVPLLAAANIRYTPNRVDIRNIQNIGDPYQAVTQAGAGAIATDSAASDASIVCILGSAIRGKQCQGRKHFGMLSEADTVKDILSGGNLANWQAVRDHLFVVMTDADGNVWTPFILSRSAKGTVSNKVPLVWFGCNCTRAKLILNVGTMRRRRPKTLYAA